MRIQRSWSCFLTFILMSLVPFPVFSDFETATRAFQNKDYPKALAEWKKLSEKGNIRSQVNLGWMYANGLGTPRDTVEAIKWYREAADKGSAEAKFNLGLLYLSGSGVTQNDLEAKNLFLQAAEKGLPEAQEKLGTIFFGEKNYTEASKWHEKLVSKPGFMEAKYQLGLMHFMGLGGEVNKKEAFKFFKEASRLGHPQAQFHLGFIYASGEQTKQDYTQAAHWYLKAAEQGVPEAQFWIATLYFSGKGTPKDLVRAYLFSNLSAAADNVDSKKFCDDLIREMSPEEIEAGKKLLKGWKPTR
jgi:uncharacterized protein